jgi:PTS system mannose-specific IIC component
VNIFLVSFVGALCSADITAFGQFMIYRPIFCAPIIGFFCGDVISGLCIGTILELFWIKTVPMGVVVIPDISMIGILSTFWACTYAPDLKDAAILSLILAIPFAYLYRLIDIFGRKLNVKIMYWVESGIKDAKNWRIETGIWAGLIFFLSRAFLFYLFSIIVGGKLFCDIYALLPKYVLSGFAKAWYLLPVAGFGIVYNMTSIRALLFRNSEND